LNTSKRKLRVSNLTIEAVKKDIRNMHLGVYPPRGRVRVAAPLQIKDEAIRLFVASKVPWIKKQQSAFQHQERETRRQYVPGESHYSLGKRYRLNVIRTDERPRVMIQRTAYIDMYVTPGMTVRQRGTVLDTFYRRELRKRTGTMLERWQQKLGVQVNEVRIRRMKTKWGSCDPNNRRVWLNLELAKKPLNCIDYVLVHELIHIVEKRHSKRFLSLLKTAMPNFEQYKEELNSGTLGHFTWKCTT
jgi:predicted metal-dependent hydrolase